MPKRKPQITPQNKAMESPENKAGGPAGEEPPAESYGEYVRRCAEAGIEGEMVLKLHRSMLPRKKRPKK